MTDEQIDMIADAHGYRVEGMGLEFTTQQFRAAVREAVRLERERCIAAIKDVPIDHAFVNTIEACAAAIRARSEVIDDSASPIN